MRTTAAAASALTSAAPLLPQPKLQEIETEESSTESGDSSPEQAGGELEENANNWVQQTNPNSMPFQMNTSDILSAYSNTSLELKNHSPSMVSAAAAAAAFGAPGVGGGQSMYQAAGFGVSPNIDVSSGTRRLVQELEDFVEKGLEGALAAERGDPGAPSEDAIAELQLQTARKLRQLLPTNRDLLHLVQERNWIPLLLGWLNLHDRPAVQVEALLALTNIAELCAQQSYYQHTASSAAATAVAAAQAATVGIADGANTSATGAGPGGAPRGSSQYYYSFPPPSGTAGTEGTPAPFSAGVPGSYTFPQPFGQTGAPGAAPLTFAPSNVPPSNFLQPLPAETVPARGSSGDEASSSSSPLFGRKDEDFPSASGFGNVNDKDEGEADRSSSSGSNSGTCNGPAPAFANFSSTSFPPPAGSPAPLTTFPPISAPFDWDKGASASTTPFGGFPATQGGAAPSLFPPSSSAPLANAPFSSLAPQTSNALATSSPSAIGAASSMFMPTTSPTTTLAGSSIPQPLSASSQHLLLRHADAIPTLISLLSSPNREVHEQAMWILGSIAAGESSTPGSGGSGSSGGSGGSPNNSGGSGSGSGGGGSSEKSSSVAARDVVLAAGVMTPLLRCLETHPLNLSLQRIGSWALSNLVEGQFQQQNGGKAGSGTSCKPTTGSDYSSSDEIEMKTLLPTLRRLLHSADPEVLSYTCWTLSHLCDGPSSHIAAVVTATDRNALPGGLVPRLVDLLLHQSWRVTKPALRTIGNIVCAECSDDGNNHNDGSSPPSPTDYTEVILDCDAVPRLKHLITHSNREIQKEACWTLSNIAAGTVDQIQAVIDSGAIPPLVQLVSDKSTDQEVRSEACWVVLNATSCGSDQQIEVLVDEGCVSVLGVLLGEASMVMMALEGLERVLQVEESREMARKARLAAARVADIADGLDLDELGENGEDRTPALVSASLIEKALEKHNSNAVSKRASRIWKQHFVSCALCRQSFSRHRTGEAHFCDECKCHVCSNCDCKVYHLSYQEELWAANEKKTEATKAATKKSKKSKKQKKKEKQKQKKLQQQSQCEQVPSTSEVASMSQQQKEARKDPATRSRSSTVTSNSGSGSGAMQLKCPPVNELSVVSSSSNGKPKDKSALSVSSEITDKLAPKKSAKSKVCDVGSGASSASQGDGDVAFKKSGPKASNRAKNKLSMSPPNTDDEGDGAIGPGSAHNPAVNSENKTQPPIDFVLYLEQTGSIIALAKLMDALEYGDSDGSGYDEEIDAELQMLSRQQHLLNRQATTS